MIIEQMEALQRAVDRAIERAEKAEAELDELKTIVQLTVESQGWDGNNPDDDRWANLYKRAREALEGKP